jgi:nucleoside-diphosphate-sugar epimerase
MRIFIAGATGVIGVRLVPLLVAAGHEVVGMTRSPGKVERLRELGAEPIVCDVFDAPGVREAVLQAAPDLVMHQLTDLPDEIDQLPIYLERNSRIRSEGTLNLIAAARDAGVDRLIAQSIAFTPPAYAETVEEHERTVLDAGGVVLRYGTLYGPGTYYETDPPDPPRVHVDTAAQRTVELLETAGPSVVVVTETDDRTNS